MRRDAHLQTTNIIVMRPLPLADAERERIDARLKFEKVTT